MHGPAAANSAAPASGSASSGPTPPASTLKKSRSIAWSELGSAVAPAIAPPAKVATEVRSRLRAILPCFRNSSIRRWVAGRVRRSRSSEATALFAEQAEGQGHGLASAVDRPARSSKPSAGEEPGGCVGGERCGAHDLLHQRRCGGEQRGGACDQEQGQHHREGVERGRSAGGEGGAE